MPDHIMNHLRELGYHPLKLESKTMLEPNEVIDLTPRERVEGAAYRRGWREGVESCREEVKRLQAENARLERIVKSHRVSFRAFIKAMGGDPDVIATIEETTNEG